MTELLFSSRRSWCHNEKCLIVKSRNGGFVSQNCYECGNSMYLSYNELPDVKCKRCGQIMSKGYDKRGNYLYTCPHCLWNKLLWDMVPHWSELFDEHGLGLDSDYYDDGQHKYKSYTRVF